MIGTYNYEPYGRVSAHPAGANIQLQYNGEWTDGETGFQYLRSRFYDPISSQFISRDPIVPIARSAYGYVRGNPLNRKDPRGLVDLPVLGPGVCLHIPGTNDGCDAGSVTNTCLRGIQENCDPTEAEQHLVFSYGGCVVVFVNLSVQGRVLTVSWGSGGYVARGPSVGWARLPVKERENQSVAAGGTYGAGLGGSIGIRDNGSYNFCDIEIDLISGQGGYEGAMQSVKQYDLPFGD